ncbi:hypothetical protein EUZ85_17015 [Hahella sp. KA22]|uniref:hypothetical protein n=1 Tax=Hahella sp. KA22 TaxID=1628392 RepID=UPI000FDED967|nr:hypothetical protein [Hahella sp. KA22]AZZ92335.1 hypothetical protein ENC22_14445 [Hahella sp. KA22]QAY55707.1 hypothetical protein EUZ85_17015 [Hahella sp. KA22]
MEALLQQSRGIKNIMNFGEVLNEIDLLEKKKLTISGIVFANKRSFFLCDSEDFSTANKITINDANVYEILSEYIEPRTGGEWEYVDHCEVSGTLLIYDGKATLSDIKHMTLKTKWISYDLYFDGRKRDPETDVSEAIRRLMVEKGGKTWISGYLVDVKEGVFLSDRIDANINDADVIKITQPDIHEVVENNFNPTVDWPEIREKVMVLAELAVSGGTVDVTNIECFKVDYGALVITFDGKGEYTWGE